MLMMVVMMLLMGSELQLVDSSFAIGGVRLRRG